MPTKSRETLEEAGGFPQHDPEKAYPGLDPWWDPVFGKIMRNKWLERMAFEEKSSRSCPARWACVSASRRNQQKHKRPPAGGRS
jgi:hypothetical protein